MEIEKREGATPGKDRKSSVLPREGGRFNLIKSITSKKRRPCKKAGQMTGALEES